MASEDYAERGRCTLDGALDIDETATRFPFNVSAAQKLRTDVHLNRHAIALLGCFLIEGSLDVDTSGLGAAHLNRHEIGNDCQIIATAAAYCLADQKTQLLSASQWIKTILYPERILSRKNVQ